MIAPRWMKVLRDLGGNKLRATLVVLSISIGIFALGMVAGTRALLAEDLTAIFARTVMPHALLFVGGVEPEELKSLRKLPDVEEIDGRVLISARYQTASGEWKDILLTAAPDFDDLRIIKFFPISGAWPPDKREVLVYRPWLAYLGWKEGDTIVIEITSGIRRELRIAGTVADLNSAPPPLATNPTGFITFETLDYLGYPETYNELYLRVRGDLQDKAHIQAVTKEVEESIKKHGGMAFQTIVLEDPDANPADQLLNPILIILGGLGGLSLFLSGFLVVNTISALLAQHTRQIGMMKAVGGQRSQIFAMYFVMVLAYGVIALALAVPAGAVGAFALASFIASLFDVQLPGVRLAPEVFAFQALVGLLMPLMAAFVPVMMGIRVTVREAISDYGLGKGGYGSSLVDRLMLAPQRILSLPRPLMLSLRNTFRRKLRLLLTVTTLTLASAIFMGIFSVRSSALQTIDDLLKYWNFDIQVSLGRAYRIEQVMREVQRVPGVTAVETWAFASFTPVRSNKTEGEGIGVLGTRFDTVFINPRILEGRWLLPEDENALVINTDVLKKEPEWKVGEWVQVKIGSHEYPFRIVGLVQGMLTGPVGYANYDYLAYLTNQSGSAGFVMVQTARHDAASQKQVIDALRSSLEAAGMQVGSVQGVAELRGTFEYIFNIIVAVLLIMALLLAAVGGLGLMGTMSINVLERTREIGVMRAIGASNSDVLGIILTEGVLIGLISWVQGLLLAIPISQLLAKAVGMTIFQTSLSYRFSQEGAEIWLAAVILLSVLASYLPARQASRLTVRDVLAYE